MALFKNHSLKHSKLLKAFALIIVILNINYMIAQDEIDNSTYDDEVHRIKELILDYDLKHKSRLIKLLKRSFRKIDFDTSNIILIPRLLFNDTAKYLTGEVVYKRLNLNPSYSNSGDIILHLDSDRPNNYMRIDLIKKDHYWTKEIEYSNNNKKPPSNSRFSINPNDYWFYVSQHPDLDKFSKIFRFYKNLTTFCLSGISSSGGYIVGGPDITAYFIFENQIYEQEFLFFRDINYEFDKISALDTSITNKHNLENILKETLYYKHQK
ncbi:MAG: hypothetical protein M9949_14755 [Candidatus Kapabacteria bacterium]|nr:hypothetical protein [Candidatus Kapabacteria bacterium]